MATTQEIIDYYVDLLIIQYHDKAKARATIDAVVKPVIMDQLPDQIMNGFDLDAAVGDQLDIIGKYADASRAGYNFNGPTVLNDSDYRKYIKLCIIVNTAGSSLYDIVTLLHETFGGSIAVTDTQDMRLSYQFTNAIGSVELAQFFVRSGKLPKPMGVGLSSISYVPALTNVFAFRTYAVQPNNVVGFNNYTTYNTNWPWLTYSDIIPL